jgi:competence protein ComEC
MQRNPAAACRHPLVILLAAAVVGIVADRFCPLPFTLWSCAAVVSLAAWLAIRRRGRLRLAITAALLAAAAAAAAWHHCQWYLFREDDLAQFARDTPHPVCIEAVALSSPRAAPRRDPSPLRLVEPGEEVRLDVAVTAIRDGAGWRPASGRASLAVGGQLPLVEAGDRLRVFAKLSLPPPPMNPGEFDYRTHLRGNRIRCQLRAKFAESVTRLAAGNLLSWRRLLDRVRTHGNRLFQQHLDPRYAGMANAVLLGGREELDPDCVEAFVETGTIHLLVIAGLHLGILAGAVLLVLRRLPISRGCALLSVAAFTLVYMLMVDAQPPVLRATVLVLCVCTAMYLGRRRLAFNSLAAAALVVLAVNPADLFRTGAQLSFLCVAGLMWFAPRWMYSTRDPDPLVRLLEENQSWRMRLLWTLGRSLRHLTLVSATIWLFTLPLTAARFHLLTPVGVLLNTVVWIPLAVTLLCGLALLMLGTLWAPLGTVCGYCCNLSLGLVEWLVRGCQRCPGGHIWVAGPPDWWLAVLYGTLALVAAFPRFRPRPRRCLALAALWIAVWPALGCLRPTRDELRCTFLAVGHGEAIVLELPTGQTVLYDVGRMSAPVAVTRTAAGFLWSRGITRLSAVVLSHGDVDHYNGLPGLLERFSVDAIYLSPATFQRRDAAVETLEAAIRRAGVPVRTVKPGQRLVAAAGCELRVLHPPPEGVGGRENANSIVLAVEYRGRRILLPGDLEPPGMEHLLAEPAMHCDVLLVPHHGSRDSDPAGLAAWSTPDWSVISAARRGDLSTVEAVYSGDGRHVLHTAHTGAITATIENSAVSVKTFLERD